MAHPSDRGRSGRRVAGRNARRHGLWSPRQGFCFGAPGAQGDRPPTPLPGETVAWDRGPGLHPIFLRPVSSSGLSGQGCCPDCWSLSYQPGHRGSSSRTTPSPPHLERGALRLGASVALVFALSSLAERLRERGLPPVWLRSLPRSANRRTAIDAATLAAIASAVAVPGVIAFRSHGALQMAGFLAWLLGVNLFVAFRLMTAVYLHPEPARPAPTGRRSGRAPRNPMAFQLVSSATTFEGLLVAAWLTILPATGFILSAALPWAWQRAAHAERRLGAITRPPETLPRLGLLTSGAGTS